MSEHSVTGRAAYDALQNSAFVPPPAATGAPGSMAWLRSTVPRFAAGAVHETRRRLVLEALASMDAELLRRRARERTQQLMTARCPDVDRVAVVSALAEALGLPEVDVAAVRTIAGVYLSGDPDPDADAAGSDLPFGAGPHACPGRDPAFALAAGVCEGLLAGS